MAYIATRVILPKSIREYEEVLGERNKARYDKSAHAAELERGDRVLVRKLGPRLDSKISDRWEKEIYVVVSKPSDMPVYTVQDESGVGAKRTLHRNYLLPIGMLDSEIIPRKVTRKTENRDSNENKEETCSCPISQDEVDSDSEEQQYSVELVFPVPNQLRAEAAEFVPQIGDINGIQEHEVDSTSSMDEQNQSTSTNDLEDAPSATDEQVGDNLDAVDQSAESESESGDGSEHRPPRPVPARRSIRTRKPVDRLNLVHRVSQIQNVVTESLEDLVQIQQGANNLLSSPDLTRQVHFALSSIQCLCARLLCQTSSS